MKEMFHIRTTPLREDASPSVLNALAILESFDAEHASQSLSELSRRLDIAKATALRNLAALEHYGYVRKDPETGLYSLGVQVLALARRFSEQNHLLSVGAQHIGELARATSETAHLSVLSGRDIVYTDVSEGSQHVRAVVSRGDRLPAHCVASGKAILAHVEPRVLIEFLAGGLPALTQRTVTSAEDFISALDDVRRLGYGTTMGEWMEEVSAVAAPVFGANDKIVGAIGIAGPRLRLGPKVLAQLASAVLLQAQRLSRELGSSGAPYGKARLGAVPAQPPSVKARRKK
jgi:IclR family KDG regulon transcriptional repressor